MSTQLDAPVVDNLEALTESYRRSLMEAAGKARTKPKLPRAEMESILMAVCRDQYVTRSCLAALLQREANALRQQYLRPLVEAEKLRLAFPTAPTHHLQAYRAL